MILRNNANPKGVRIPNQPNRGQFGARAVICKHGFPQGTVKKTQVVKRGDTLGFYQVDAVDTKDGCTHK